MTDDVKITRHTGEVETPDDPSLPFKLEVVLRPPGLMLVAWIAMNGGCEEIVARAASAEPLQRFMDRHDLRRHPRLTRFTITGPDGLVESG